jgi:hypothetical protein
MNEFYVTNRDVIKNLAINTGTSSVPVFTNLCTASELTLNQDFSTKDWYVFCDSIQRSIITGVAMSVEGTIKLDINNKAIEKILGDIHTLIASGTISQFNNILARFDLLTKVEGGVLEYTTYQVPVSFSLSDLGGAAEDEADFGITINIIGKGTVVASS